MGCGVGLWALEGEMLQFIFGIDGRSFANDIWGVVLSFV